MFTKDEYRFIKNSLSSASAQGIDNMKLIIGIVEKCDLAIEDKPAVREVKKDGK